mmetsp:Transcript_16328/g.26962  ORF Transcript_16328/g.26962 Transcript_16328/m.26962 type:complete len:344 (+) Transcript_16328:982-2013(+)
MAFCSCVADPSFLSTSIASANLRSSPVSAALFAFSHSLSELATLSAAFASLTYPALRAFSAASSIASAFNSFRAASSSGRACVRSLRKANLSVAAVTSHPCFFAACSALLSTSKSSPEAASSSFRCNSALRAVSASCCRSFRFCSCSFLTLFAHDCRPPRTFMSMLFPTSPSRPRSVRSFSTCDNRSPRMHFNPPSLASSKSIQCKNLSTNKYASSGPFKCAAFTVPHACCCVCSSSPSVIRLISIRCESGVASAASGASVRLCVATLRAFARALLPFPVVLACWTARFATTSASFATSERSSSMHISRAVTEPGLARTSRGAVFPTSVSMANKARSAARQTA